VDWQCSIKGWSSAVASAPEQTGLSADDRAALAERRREFWRWVARIAVGGLIALTVWTAVLYVIVSESSDGGKATIELSE
jgi:hypothetical protein